MRDLLSIFSPASKPGLVLVVLGMIASNGQAQSGGSDETIYRLNQNSTFEQGCFPPCMCPIMTGSAPKGTFVLRPTGFDGLFNTYAVENVNWVVSAGNTNKLITGKGTYKVGGEFALEQELSLLLQVDGATAEHFDSGLVPDETQFPDLKVTVSIHGQVCFDTVISVSASPMRLAMVTSGTKVLLTWPTNLAGLTLQCSTNLGSSAAWTPVSAAPSITNGENTVIKAASGAQQFFRLGQ
jgi:hypothetical protein